MEAGQLVRDDIILGVIRDELGEARPRPRGVIFDGVVRTIPQAEGRGTLPRRDADAGSTTCSSSTCRDAELLGGSAHAATSRARADDDPAAVRNAAQGLPGPDRAGDRLVRGSTAGSPRRAVGQRRRRSRPGAMRGAGGARDHHQVGARDRHDGARRPHRAETPRADARGSCARDLAPRTSIAWPRSSSARIPGATPSFKGLYDFPTTLCTSINEEIVHGIPSHEAGAARGAIVSRRRRRLHRRPARRLGHHHSRSARSPPEATAAARGDPARARRRASPRRAPAITSATSATRCSRWRKAAGFGVVRELVGHGIGTRFHEEPQVPNFGTPKRGPRLRAGMTIAIEPMITMGEPGHPHACATSGRW